MNLKNKVEKLERALQKGKSDEVDWAAKRASVERIQRRLRGEEISTETDEERAKRLEEEKLNPELWAKNQAIIALIRERLKDG